MKKILSIALGTLMVAGVLFANAQSIIYYDDFDNDGFNNTGTGGGLKEYAVNKKHWVDDGELIDYLEYPSDPDNRYGFICTSNEWTSTTGFRVTLKYTVDDTSETPPNRASFGLASGAPSAASSAASGGNPLREGDLYAVGYNLTERATLGAANLGGQGLVFNPGGENKADVLLSNPLPLPAISNIVNTAVISYRADNTYSFSQNGSAVTTGVINTNGTFDLDQAFWFFFYGQGNNSKFKVQTVQVETLADTDAALYLFPGEELGMTLGVPDTVTADSVDVAFSYGPSSNDVVITSASFINATHPGAFTCTDSFPLALSTPEILAESLNVEFNNSSAGLENHLETSTATLEVTWNEVGSGTFYTAELPVVVTYEMSAAILSFDPSDQFLISTVADSTPTAKSFGVSYAPSMAVPTNVVIDSVTFASSDNAAAFTCLSSFPMTLTEGATNDVLVEYNPASMDVGFGEYVECDLVVAWHEMGSSESQEDTLAVGGNYVYPTTGGIMEFSSSMPTNEMLFYCEPETEGGYQACRRQGVDTFRILHQSIHGSNFTEAVTFDGLFLRPSAALDLSDSEEPNQLEIWFGTVTGDSIVVDTYARETFDCSRKFSAKTYYQFMLSSPVLFSPDSLGMGESFAFQIRWVDVNSGNEMFISQSVSSEDVIGGKSGYKLASSFPSSPPDYAIADRDLYFGLAYELMPVDSVSDVSGSLDDSGNFIVGFTGEEWGMYALQYRGGMVYETWTNLVEDIEGIGTINVTNDTTDAQGFYRVILQ